MKKFVAFTEGLAFYADSNEETLGVCGTKAHGKIATEAIRWIGRSTAFDWSFDLAAVDSRTEPGDSSSAADEAGSGPDRDQPHSARRI